jgi:hypothetical protein
MGRRRSGEGATRPERNSHILERTIREAVILARCGVARRNYVGKEAGKALKCVGDGHTLLR